MMKNMVAAFLAVCGASVMVWADVSVYDVRVQPRTPWNGLVDVSYSVACDDPNADVYVTPTAYDGDRRITLFPKTLSGDGAEAAVKPGKHTMTWDAKKDLGIFSSSKFSMKIHAGERLPRYVVIDLSEGANATNYPVRFSVVGPDLSNDICRTTELWLRLVPPGEFWMGSPTDELGRSNIETRHHVILTQPFYMGVFEVTQKQWELVHGDNPAYFKLAGNSAVRPVENMTYFAMRGTWVPDTSTGLDSGSFVSRLRSRAKISDIDVPSEARWEYACRAGRMEALNNGKNLLNMVSDASVAEVAAYYGNRHNDKSYNASSEDVGTMPIGSYEPNNLGLYDMHGNVSELCRDGNGTEHAYDIADVVDPKPWNRYSSDSLYLYVAKGGSWKTQARNVRSAFRGRESSYNSFYSTYHTSELCGFRICCEIGF